MTRSAANAIVYDITNTANSLNFDLAALSPSTLETCPLPTLLALCDTLHQLTATVNRAAGDATETHNKRTA